MDENKPKKSKAFLITFIVVLLILVIAYILYTKKDQIFHTKSSTDTKSFTPLDNSNGQKGVAVVPNNGKSNNGNGTDGGTGNNTNTTGGNGTGGKGANGTGNSTGGTFGAGAGGTGGNGFGSSNGLGTGSGFRQQTMAHSLIQFLHQAQMIHCHRLVHKEILHLLIKPTPTHNKMFQCVLMIR